MSWHDRATPWSPPVPQRRADALPRVCNLDDFEALAAERMEPAAFAYYVGGSSDEVTLRANRQAFRARLLRPRVLRGVSAVDLSTEMLGSRVSMPVGLAPAALQALAHPEGELAAARAAAAAGVVYCLSTLSSHSIEDVAAAAAGPRWFQLYVQKDRGLTEELVARAVSAGYQAIVLTVDVPVSGYRDRELRSLFGAPEGGMGNFAGIGSPKRDLIHFVADRFDASLTWADVGWVRGLSTLPLVVKGILCAEDAVLAVEHGASGIVVSNHGGRQLDRTPPTIDVLDEVVDAVAGRCEVYLDGGVRRAADALSALALGARAVFIGRPYLFALAAAGEPGVRRALELFAEEMRNVMMLLGAADLGAVTRACLHSATRGEKRHEK